MDDNLTEEERQAIQDGLEAYKRGGYTVIEDPKDIWKRETV